MSAPVNFDSLFWLLLVPGVVLGLIASIRLRWAHAIHSKSRTDSGLTGCETAHRILDANGLSDTPVIEIPGRLTDHFDLLQMRLCLSSENYHGRSIAAIGIAAHEAGHALQQRDAYLPFRIRVRLIPIASVVTPLSIVLVLAGFFVSGPMGRGLLMTGIILFALATVFQLFSLPVEFNASKRALNSLRQLELISDSESRGIAKMLNAAAMTYASGLIYR